MDQLSYKAGFLAFALAICIPIMYRAPWEEQVDSPALGVKCGVIPKVTTPVMDYESEMLVRRAGSPTDVCIRWAHQCETLFAPPSMCIYADLVTKLRL